MRWVQFLNQLVDLDEILYGSDDINDDLDSMFFNLVPSTIPERWMFKLLRLVQRNPLITFG
jgi:hypothetical protein